MVWRDVKGGNGLESSSCSSFYSFVHRINRGNRGREKNDVISALISTEFFLQLVSWDEGGVRKRASLLWMGPDIDSGLAGQEVS